MRLISKLSKLSPKGVIININPHERANMPIVVFLVSKGCNSGMIDSSRMQKMLEKNSLVIISASPFVTVFHYDLKEAVVEAIERVVFG